MKKIFCATLIFFLAAGSAYGTENRWSWRLSAAQEHLAFIKHRFAHGINDQTTFNGFWEVKWQDEKNLIVLMKPRLRFDFLDHSRNRYEPRETYLTYYSGGFELTLGQQLFSFGSATSYNPTDFLNRRDLEDNYYDPEKLGELAAKTSYSASFAGAVQEIAFTTYIIPLFRETPLPELDTRFALQGVAGGFPYTVLEDQDRPNDLARMKFGAKLGMVIENIDLSFLYFHGPEWEPGFVFAIDSAGLLRLAPFYYSVDVAGLDLQATVGNWLMRIESAYKNTAANDQRAHVIAAVGQNAVPASYIQFVPGLEYTFDNLGAAGEITLIAEYLGEDTHTTALNSFRPFKNDVFLGWEWNVNDHRQTIFKSGVIKDLGTKEAMIAFSFERKLYKELKLIAEGLIIQRGDDAQSPLSIFDNNSYLLGKLEYTWGGKF